MFAGAVAAPNCRALSLCCLLGGFQWWLGLAVRLDGYPKPTAGVAVKLVCVVIFPFLQDKSWFGEALTAVGDAYRMR